MTVQPERARCTDETVRPKVWGWSTGEPVLLTALAQGAHCTDQTMRLKVWGYSTGKLVMMGVVGELVRAATLTAWSESPCCTDEDVKSNVLEMVYGISRQGR